MESYGTLVFTRMVSKKVSSRLITIMESYGGLVLSNMVKNKVSGRLLREWKLGSIGSYKDGKREGEWKFYKENGKLEKIVHYKNGELIKTEYPK